MINERKTLGSKFIENLAADIRISFPNVKGYSVRNLKYMAKFAETYPDEEFVQTVSEQIPWSHNTVILDKVKDADQRVWYILSGHNFLQPMRTLPRLLKCRLWQQPEAHRASN